MVLTNDLARIVTKQIAEYFIGRQDFSVRLKFDDRLRFRNRIQNGFGIATHVKKLGNHHAAPA